MAKETVAFSTALSLFLQNQWPIKHEHSTIARVLGRTGSENSGTLIMSGINQLQEPFDTTLDAKDMNNMYYALGMAVASNINAVNVVKYPIIKELSETLTTLVYVSLF